VAGRITGIPGAANKAIVGRNAFAHESRHPPGRHAQEPSDLRDHDAENGGSPDTIMVLGKHSGRNATTT
jgi:2-isopropylmalate synthase